MRETILGGGQILFFRLEMKLPTIRSNNASRIQHRRAWHQAALDSLAKRGVGIVTRIADVANRRKPRREHVPCVRNSFNGAVRTWFEHVRIVMTRARMHDSFPDWE